MQIWPAIDIRGGKCVRLTQGDYERETVYGANPADMASRWASDGANAMHIVDLDGARDGKPGNREAIKQIVESVSFPCQVGGGVRTEESIAELLDCGVSQIVVGTKAINEPNWLRQMAEKFPQKLVLGADAKQGFMATDGWERASDVSGVDFVKSLADLPLAAIVYTDIAKDGMLSGPNFEALEEIQQASSHPVIASGGVTTVEDVRRLAALNLDGCIIGRALYSGHLTLVDALSASALATPVDTTAG